jgi:uncharacterized protein YkwD
MRRLISTAALASCLALAACGGDDSDNAAAPPTTASTSTGGTVGADATVGRLGPAASVDEDGRETIIGEEGPIAADADQPTDAQRNGVAGGVACASGALAPSASNLKAVASATICLLNAERANKGLAPLRLNGKLNNASKLMSNLMVRQHFFAHDTPDGRSVLDRVRPTGYIRGSWSLGENIAWGSGGLATPRAIVNGWMNSKGHRDNILFSKFKDIGIGVTLGAPQRGLSGGATYVTDFGRHG